MSDNEQEIIPPDQPHLETKRINPLRIPGILLIVLGVLAMLMPVAASFAINVVLGLILLLVGLLLGGLGMAIDGPGKWPSLIAAGVALSVGVMMLANPVEGATAISVILSVFFAVKGMSALFLAYDLRPRPGWAWALLSGGTSLLLGFLMILGLPEIGPSLPGLLLGIYLAVHGGLLILMGRGFSIRVMQR